VKGERRAKRKTQFFRCKYICAKTPLCLKQNANAFYFKRKGVFYVRFFTGTRSA
jgi:hypothetical protein